LLVAVDPEIFGFEYEEGVSGVGEGGGVFFEEAWSWWVVASGRWTAPEAKTVYENWGGRGAETRVIGL
jgi:hypothetical protein